MARTIRRKNRTEEYYWALRETIHTDRLAKMQLHKYDTISFSRWGMAHRGWVDVHFYKGSEIGKRMLAKYHGDAGTHKCKEPGPSYWRNLTAQRPYRQDSKTQIKKYLLNTEYEVIIRNMPVLVYWT